MTPQTHPIDERHLGLAAEVAYETNRLSAVPFEGWCDKAAEMLATKAPEAIISVTVARFEPNGALRKVYCEGTRYPESIDGRAREKSAGISKADLSSLNWWIRSDKPAVALLRDLPKNENWVSSPSGAQWNAFDVQHMIVGLGKIPGANEQKHIAIEIGYPRGSESAPSHACAAVLRAVMPLLCGRAGLAFNTYYNGLMITNREIEVLEELINGRSVRQIAEALGRSEHTIHDHVKSLHRKLGASSRGELIARALGHLSIRNDIRISPSLRPSVEANRAEQIDEEGVALSN